MRRRRKRHNPRRRRHIFSTNPRRRKRHNPHKRRYRRNPDAAVKAISVKKTGKKAKRTSKRAKAKLAAFGGFLGGVAQAAAAAKARGRKAADTRKKRALAKKRKQRKAYLKRKRTMAAKHRKPARRKARKTGRKTHRKGRKSSKRSRAAKRAWKTRRARGHVRGRKRSHRRGRRPLWKKYRGKSLRRARYAIKRARRRRKGKAYSYARHYRMRSNPSLSGIWGTAKTVVKRAVPIGVGYLGGRKLTEMVSGMLPIQLGVFQQPLVSAVLLGVGNWVLGKGKLGKKLGAYKGDIVLGLALNVATKFLTSLIPSIANFIGLSDYVQIPGSMSDYIYREGGATGDYVDVSEDYAELGALEAMGAGGALQEMGSLGAWNPKLLAGAIPTKGAAAVIQHRANAVNVPAWAPAAEEENYQGIFANRLIRDVDM